MFTNPVVWFTLDVSKHLWRGTMSMSRKKVAVIAAEFLGTTLLTLVILSVSKSSIGIPYFVALAGGLAVAAGTLFFADISGAHFNPAISLGSWTVRRTNTAVTLVYVAAQLLGGVAGYLLFSYLVNQTWHNSGHFEGRVLVAEAAGAFVFSLGWAVKSYHHLEASKAAAVVGIAFALGVMVASTGGGGLINPALALGVRSWVWGTYVLGPILGAVIGFNLYSLLFAPTASLVGKATSSVRSGRGNRK
jgi:aquaporin Z